MVVTLPINLATMKGRESSADGTFRKGLGYALMSVRYYSRPPKKGKYAMEVSKNLCVEAEHDPCDVGYLHCGYQLRSPPNYGCYINASYAEDVVLGEYSFNCAFVGEDSGLNVV